MTYNERIFKFCKTSEILLHKSQILGRFPAPLYTSDLNVSCNVNVNLIFGGLSKLYKNCKNLVHSRQGRLLKCKIENEHELFIVSIEMGRYSDVHLYFPKNAIWSLGIVYLTNHNLPGLTPLLTPM